MLAGRCRAPSLPLSVATDSTTATLAVANMQAAGPDTKRTRSCVSGKKESLSETLSLHPDSSWMRKRLAALSPITDPICLPSSRILKPTSPREPLGFSSSSSSSSESELEEGQSDGGGEVRGGGREAGGTE